MKYRLTKQMADAIAEIYGYTMHEYQENIGMVSYYDKSGKVRVNVYLSTMTVATCMKHPKKGKTQLFRRNITEGELHNIFENPRQHTGKGYYKTKNKKKYGTNQKSGGSNLRLSAGRSNQLGPHDKREPGGSSSEARGRINQAPEGAQ